MEGEGGRSEIVDKLMSVSRAEFEAGLIRLTGTRPQPNGPDGYLLGDIGAEQESVFCSFEALPDAVLGKLLTLPQARVRLHLASLSPEARAKFLALFDRTFQRGGG